VVVFTSSDRPADIQRSFELGVKDFIQRQDDCLTHDENRDIPWADLHLKIQEKVIHFSMWS
jgi:hypothetical protein